MVFNTKKIKEFLTKNPDYFCNENSANTIQDVITFKMQNVKNIVFIDDYFLCDIYENEIWICKNLKTKKYDSIRGKKIIAEATQKVMNTRDKDGKSLFNRFNGYWTIPDINNEGTF